MDFSQNEAEYCHDILCCELSASVESNGEKKSNESAHVMRHRFLKDAHTRLTRVDLLYPNSERGIPAALEAG